jgi:PST family polysaccharide transporter
MLRFGLNITGFCLADFGGRSGDRVAIGYKIGATGLGQYQSALFVHENLIDVLVFPLHGVAVAGLSKLRDNMAELRKSWAKALCTLAFFAMPAFGLLAVTSRDLIPLLLGAKWSSAGVLLSVLAFRGLPQSLDRTVGWLHVTAGRTDRWMRWGLLTTGAQLVAVFCGLPFGPMGVAVASVVMAFLLVLPGLAYAGRPLEIGAVDAMEVVWRPLVASLLAASLALLLRGSLESVHSFTRITVVGLAYVLSYLVVVVGIFNEWTPVRTTHALISGYVPARFRTFSQARVSDLVNSPDS